MSAMLAYFVFLVAKTVQYIVRKLGRGGGSALPGLIADRLYPRMLALLTRNLQGTIVVCGTNGKTTTTRLIASLLEGEDHEIIHNRSGSNLIRGILAALIKDTSWGMKAPSGWGLFEVDEAVLPKLLAVISPNFVVVTNLFRDQLDRYGEIDSIARQWREACALLPESSTLVLNADDPMVASLGKNSRCKVVYFGVDYAGPSELAPHADSRRCPFCHASLHFSQIVFSHLGCYSCPTGDFEHPEVAYRAHDVVLQGMSGCAFDLVLQGVEVPFDLRLAGVYNVYNAVAAAAIADLFAMQGVYVQKRFQNFGAVFGRLETIRLGSVTLVLILVKNPTGYNQVIQTLLTDPSTSQFWHILNDRTADGRDISWIWDVEFEALVARSQRTIVSGSRALELAVRLKYAGYDGTAIRVSGSLSDSLRLISGYKNETVYCLCTYTGMMELREILQRQHSVGAFYQD